MVPPLIPVLCIDDEESIRTMTHSELSKHGFDVLLASDGAEGVALFRQHPCPVVVCDLKMPKMNGLQVLQAIKALDPDTEVLIATGWGSNSDALDCLRAGAYDYITKPFSMEELSGLLHRAMERRQIKIHLGLYECLQTLGQSLEPERVLEAVSLGLKKSLRADDVCFETTAQPVILAPAERTIDPLLLPETEAVSGGLFSLSAPLIHQARSWGSVTVIRRSGSPPFSEADKRSLLLFVSQAVHALENATLHRSLEEKVRELEQTREQLIQSEKMSALGRMAAGVAHEINNPLTGILGQAQVILLRLAEADPLHEDLTFIESAAQRCRRIVQDLLQFSRRQKLDRQSKNLWDVVDQSLRFMRKALELKNIRVEKFPTSEALTVFISPMHVTQVLLNLFQNAVDSMRESGGVLKIRAERTAETVRISVSDTGPGIPPEVLPHIWEPFFTTKEVGQGTGLGLPVSLGIMRDHGGSIEVVSPCGAQAGGAEFTLIFPILQGVPMLEEPALSPGEAR
jgi:two-component system, NtrC family, sensor kinase